MKKRLAALLLAAASVATSTAQADVYNLKVVTDANPGDYPIEGVREPRCRVAHHLDHQRRHDEQQHDCGRDRTTDVAHQVSKAGAEYCPGGSCEGRREQQPRRRI